MPKVAPIDQRKADHIKINLEKDVRSTLTTGLENYHFVHEAFPELDLKRVDTSLSLFGKQLAAPILISSMTGGTEEAGEINQRLAEAAQEMNIAMGVGQSTRRARTSRTNFHLFHHAQSRTRYFIVCQSRGSAIQLQLRH